MTVTIPEQRASFDTTLGAIRARFPDWTITEAERGGYQARLAPTVQARPLLGIYERMSSGSLTMLRWRLEHQEDLRTRLGLPR